MAGNCMVIEGIKFPHLSTDLDVTKLSDLVQKVDPVLYQQLVTNAVMPDDIPSSIVDALCSGQMLLNRWYIIVVADSILGGHTYEVILGIRRALIHITDNGSQNFVPDETIRSDFDEVFGEHELDSSGWAYHLCNSM